MQRHKHRPRPVRRDRPGRTPGQGWQIGPTPSRAAPEAPAVTITLDFPIEVDGETRSTLTMRHPTPKDWAWFRLQHGAERDRTVKMMARLCGLPTDAIGELDHADLFGLVDACDAMMGEG